MSDLQQRVALITGAGSGIGRATAICLAKEGAQVALLGIDAKALEETSALVRQCGGDAILLPADVTDAERMSQVAAQLQAMWGRLDIVVANAGINGVWASIDELSAEDWRKTLDVNLTGSFLTIKYAVPALRKNGGSVILMSSVNGTRMFSNGGATAYAASKAGQVALTKMLALELAKDRIRVNAICPGSITTPIHEKTEKESSDLKRAREPVDYPAGIIPLTDGRPGEPEQVAQLVLFLASDNAAHITGSVTFIDGGESLLQG
jgi:NAD(P)-dependent dehydrogenase (short-subunit alcohol dehydrogenase family)